VQLAGDSIWDCELEAVTVYKRTHTRAMVGRIGRRQ